MSIIRRSLIIIAVAFIAALAICFVVVSELVMTEIADHELIEMESEFYRAGNAIGFSLRSLEKYTSDWSVWQETYVFVQDGNQQYIDANLMDSTFSGQDVNVMMFFNRDQQLVYGKWFDLRNDQAVSAPPSQTLLINDRALFNSTKPHQSVMGLVDLPEGPMMVVVQAVFSSDLDQPPMGYLLCGRYLKDDQWEEITGIIQSPMQFVVAGSDGSGAGLDVLNPSAIEKLDHRFDARYDTLEGSVAVNDIQGEKVFTMRLEKSRGLYKEGWALVRTILPLIGAILLLTGLCIFIVLKRQVLNRLVALTDKIALVESLERIPDFNDPGSDEIATLAQHLKRMFGDLQNTHRELHYASIHDPLTGLYNRMYYDQQIAELDADREAPKGVIMCDIDGLKLVNELGGHCMGDQHLLKLGTILRQECPPEALIARVGGDEFVIILSNNEDAYLEDLCKRVQTEFEQISQTDVAIVNPTLSLGYASNSRSANRLNELVIRADHLMHRKKLHRIQSGYSGQVNTLRSALRARDFETEDHAHRLGELIARLAYAMGVEPQRIPDMLLFAEFHDIGKIGIPDRILLKPGVLDEQERMQMQKHSEIGYRIARATPDLAPIAGLILNHHEWWNGGGYPGGFKGGEIPEECRILAVVDAYDAMINDRPYRTAMSQEEALDELRRCAGSQFDPMVVEKFVNIIIEEYPCEWLTHRGK